MLRPVVVDGLQQYQNFKDTKVTVCKPKEEVIAARTAL